MVENLTPPFMAQISYVLARCELRYIFPADVIEFWRPRAYFLTRIVLRVPMRGVRDFDFAKKR